MPKRNQIEMQGLVDRIVDKFHKDKMSQRDISDQLKDEGFKVSKSGVGRTLKTHASQMAAYKRAAKEAVAIVAELKDNPGLDITEATAQLLQIKILEEVKQIESLDDLDSRELINAAHKNTLSQVGIARVRLEYERGYRQGLFKAAEKVDEVGRKAGISQDKIDLVKAQILGIKVALP